jgi:hypothetical protein
MYSKAKSGATSHKINTNPILKFYYGHPNLFIFCFGNEGFFVASYVLKHAKGPVLQHFLGGTWHLWELLWLLAAPFFVCKQFFNVVQLLDACQELAEIDNPTKKAPSASSSNKKK